MGRARELLARAKVRFRVESVFGRVRSAWSDPGRRRRFLVAAGSALGLAIGAWVAWDASRVEIRVLNTTSEVGVLAIDRTRRVPLPTVAVETPNAGVVVRVSPGRHRLALEASGAELDFVEATLEAGGRYLYVPGDTDQCFFVEHAAYGEAHALLPPLREIPRSDRLVRLPDRVDAWFVPNPPPSTDDKRSSGGTRTAIRQARCGTTPWR